MRFLMIVALLPLGVFQQRSEMPFRVVERQSFRVQEFKSDTRQGSVVFETVLENITASYAYGLVSFSSYLLDGTKRDECKADPFTIAPKEKARVICRGDLTPLDIRLQVTMRLHNFHTYALTQSTMVTVAEQGVRRIGPAPAAVTSPDVDLYEAWALLQSKGGDAEVRYAFRFYGEDGIQIAEHIEPQPTLVEPEVRRRVTWRTTFFTQEHKPVSVRTYVFDISEPAKKGAK